MITVTVRHFGKSEVDHKYIRNSLCNQHTVKIQDTIRNKSEIVSEIKIQNIIQNASEMNHKYPLRAVSQKIRNVFYRNFPPDSQIHGLLDPTEVAWVSSETSL